jgi:3-phenylpropionate/trans-cinnamate dioxygenase ferredoxin subunit
VSEKRKVVAGPVASFPPGQQKSVDVDGRAIAVFNVGGRFYALRDVCPHQGAALSGGVVTSSITATCPGEYEFHPEQKLVRCPWHGWAYDLATGQSWSDPDHSRVRHYPIEIEPGTALIAEQAGFGGRVPGPYVAETISISVENDYVVIEV